MRKLFLLSLWALIMLTAVFCKVQAQVVLPPIFNCNMVLQQGIEIPVWGWASPGEKVSVTFDRRTITTKAGTDGRWSVKLPAMNYGGPYSMVIKGKNLRTIENIMIGEVWVCSGQSNMEWPLKLTINSDQEIKNSNNPAIRLFTVPKRVSQFPQANLEEGEWWECSPVSAPDFSAVAYYFGKELNRELKVPVGLINVSWGGTVAETWTSSETISKDPDFAALLQKLQQIDIKRLAELKVEELKARLGEFPVTDMGWQNDVATWAMPEFGDSEWRTMTLPGYVEERGLDGFDGVVWFRKTVVVSSEDAQKEAEISLARIDDSDIVWVNGVKIGGKENQYNELRQYTIPKEILKEGNNVITIRMEDTGGNGGLYGQNSEMKLLTSANEIPLWGEWRYKIGKVNLNLSSMGPNEYPTLLFNGMINPIVPYGIRGAIWYQGESNADRAEQYKRIFPNMITDWRTHWNQGDFPFLFVQLANFMSPDAEPTDSNWARLREAQTQTLELPNTGMAVIIDAGEAYDIHPRDKQTVGFRLAQSAKKVAYKRDVVYSGPVYSEFKVSGNKVTVSFLNTADGLMAKDKYGYLKGFAVAGADKKFYWAEARIVGEDQIELYSKEVENPVAVRYAWGNNPDDVNLYNRQGLPACPFRTDSW